MLMRTVTFWFTGIWRFIKLLGVIDGDILKDIKHLKIKLEKFGKMLY